MLSIGDPWVRSETPVSLSLPRVRAFNAVFEMGSMSQAARRLGVTQPTISQQIGELEQHYGVVLFHRRGSGLTPSDIGRSLYAATQSIRLAEAEALAILESHRAFEAGELAIGLGNTMPGMAVVADFVRRFGQIRVRIETGSWASVLQAVIERRVDVGILPEVPDDGRFRRSVCLKQRVVALARADDPLAAEAQTTCGALAERALVFRTRASSTQRVVDRAFARGGHAPTPRLVVDSRDGVVEAVAAGLGIGFVWEGATNRSQALVRLPVVEMAESHAEYVFALTDRRDRLVELFLEAGGRGLDETDANDRAPTRGTV